MRKSSQKSIRVVAIVGPTASGKSSLAIQLAKRFSGEVISADSRQVYRGMDLGTGKVTKAEQRKIPHFCLSCASPKTTYSLPHFVRDAQRAIRKIVTTGNVPIVCGGTGFWIDSLLRGTSIPNVPPNKKLRKQLSNKTPSQLFTLLKKLDPYRAAHIDVKNPVRLIRSIEIAKKLGKVPAIINTSPYSVLWIGVRLSKKDLVQRTAKRLHQRLDLGMINEVRRLHSQGVSWKRLFDFGLEYRYVSLYVRGMSSKQEMVHKLETEIVQYAKRQMTWFKRNQDIHWIRKPSEALPLVRSFVKN